MIQTKFFSNTLKKVTNGDDKIGQCNHGPVSEVTAALIDVARNTRPLRSQNVLPFVLPFAYARASPKLPLTSQYLPNAWAIGVGF